MSTEQQDFHVEFMASKVRRLQELQKDGKRDVAVSLDELVMIYVECIGLHLHLARLEAAVGTAFEFTSLLKTVTEQTAASPESEKVNG